MNQEHEIRFYLKQIKALMAEPTEEDIKAGVTARFVPQYMVTATQLPTGAIELAVNNSNIESKIDYILEAYDDEMHLKTNPDIVMQNIMIV